MTDVSGGNGERRAWHRHPGARLGLWAIVGAACGYPVGWLLAEYEDSVPAVAAVAGTIGAAGLTGFFAAMVIAGLLAGGIFMLVLSRLPDARLLKALQAEADENPRRMRTMLPIAGWGMLLYAILILTFLIPGIPAAAGIVIVGLCFAAVSWLFWRGTQMMDELERAAQREGLVATFIIVEALGIGWAVLHHYALAPAIEPVALVTLLTVIYFTMAMVAASRRGLAQ